MSGIDQKLIGLLKQGRVAVMRTDTIYGIVGSALDRETVEKIYQARRRAPEKPCIILIASAEELKNFSIRLTDAQKEKLKEYWPGPVSIIFDCADEKIEYLHRGTHTLAFRMPAPEHLRGLLRETGPLIAPSANTEGQPPAKNIVEAQNYFGEAVDCYADGGEAIGAPSKIIKLHADGTVSIIRP